MKTGYTFTGWAPKDESYNSGAYITASKERVITLYAQWKANEYTITYKDEGDVACTATTNTSPTKHIYDSVTILENPTKTSASTTKGYEFAGWYTDSACSDGNRIYTLAVLEYTADITLYAKWRGWVQLWEGGPKFAEFNIGSTITDYASATETTDAEKYTTANVGGLYGWGGNSTNSRDDLINPDYKNSGLDSLSGDDDTARKKWGSNWKMPSKDNFDALLNSDNCIWTWCDGSTVQYVPGCTLAGAKVTGKGDYANNSIFLPAAGSYIGGLSLLGTNGRYWSSTPNGVDYAYRFEVKNSGNLVDDRYRNGGFSVRAILAE